MKIYTKNSNYLLLGLRHQQGFGSSTSYGSQNWTDIPVSENISYTGLFIGNGINTDGWFEDANRTKAPMPEIENPWSNGINFMGTASLRRVIDPVYDPTDDFQNVSTAYMLGGWLFEIEYRLPLSYIN